MWWILEAAHLINSGKFLLSSNTWFDSTNKIDRIGERLLVESLLESGDALYRLHSGCWSRNTVKRFVQCRLWIRQYWAVSLLPRWLNQTDSFRAFRRTLADKPGRRVKVGRSSTYQAVYPGRSEGGCSWRSPTANGKWMFFIAAIFSFLNFVHEIHEKYLKKVGSFPERPDELIEIRTITTRASGLLSRKI